MVIKTNVPVLSNPNKILKNIASFWNTLSPAWKTVWGQHIHHGYYEFENNFTPSEAQEKLIEKLSDLITLQSQDKILDVGCGFGGSAFFLAKQFSVQVTGITLSVEQIKIASAETPSDLSNQISFKLEDAHTLQSFPDNYFNVVWSLESCEQFYDKELFIKQALRVLKPGGKLMIATWCADKESYFKEEAKRYLTLCKAFDLPYMPTFKEYSNLLGQYFDILSVQDWSLYVKNSWSIGLSQLKNFSLWQLFKLSGFRGFWFINKLKLMSEAFQSGQIRYGVFIAQKKAASNVGGNGV